MAIRRSGVPGGGLPPGGGRNGDVFPKGSGGRDDVFPKGSGGRDDVFPKGSGGRDDVFPKGSGGRGLFGTNGSGGGWVVVAFISPTSLDIPGLAHGIVSGEPSQGDGFTLSGLAEVAQAEARRRATVLDGLRASARQLDVAKKELADKTQALKVVNALVSNPEKGPRILTEIKKATRSSGPRRAAKTKPKPKPKPKP